VVVTVADDTKQDIRVNSPQHMHSCGNDSL